MATTGAMSTELAMDGVDQGGLELVSDEKWVPSSTVHAAPIVKVSQPTGAFCQMDSRFSVPLPPDDVYDIIIDPNNRRVFKNVKEVTYRKILEDDGNRQKVEVEQLGRWRFLVFSGAFACRVIVDQNRQEHSMKYVLAREGMMKKFVGSWKVDPIYEEDAESSSAESSSAEESSETPGKLSSKGKLTGSWVTLQQVVQPALVPPWPLSTYVKGVSGQIVQDVCTDLQLEAIRLAELKASADVEKDSDMLEVD